jgi:hypothetical protein
MAENKKTAAARQPGDAKKVQVTLMLNPEDWQAMRIVAIQEQRPASEIINELITGYLKRKASK